ncbi:serine/threonine-protein kinase [Streptomyces zingiberis]|uniref:non-specific serine/threonine protein kinase n=1 Tax=Streptomyces zingiberis TaxID=2053010 RepID=A0ABX1BSN4_9ACTN|nr:serine/threonine-protein kinase [Streptomyces zingiberis]NJQ00735.1 serine/threonine protein kinase [Streptomyces zingiberis]
MTKHGGRADEPTSYLIRPPDAPATGHAPPAPDGRDGAARPGGEGAGAESGAARHPVTADGTPTGRGVAPDGFGPLTGGAPGGGAGEAAGGPSGPALAPGFASAPAHASPPAPPSGEVPGEAPGPGRVVGGRYRLLSRLGHGGMGTVWKARDEVVEREVAVKEPRVPDQLSQAETETVYRRMRREARAAAAIDHPSVVTVHDVVVEEGRPWIVMELVRGQSLGDRLAEGTLDPREAARIGLDVLGALTAAHEAGVLHRDVKPDNVLLGRYDRVVLTDFGIAQVEGEQRLTETGAFVGSPEFIAPERVLGRLPGPESDLWSLGVLLYAAVEGMSPYRRSNTPATLQAVLSAEPAPPARGAGALGGLVMQLLRKDPAGRPTPAEIRTVLMDVARPPRPAPAPAAPAGPVPSGPAAALRGRKGRLGLVGGVLAATLVTVLLVNPFGGDDGPPEGWKLREEGEIVKASLILPGDYRRTEAEEGYVTFADPSGVYRVELWRDEDPAPGERTIGPPDPPNPETAAEAAEELVAYYEDGGENSVEEARSTTREALQQGREAAQVFTTYRAYAAGDDDVTRHYREHLYVSEERVRWRLRVSMPAEGHARPEGEALFREVVRHLRIQQL